jgi:hypothetical protein
VRGYKEEGTTTTPFDMVVLNNLDRYQLALDAVRRIPRFSDQLEKATARYWTSMERTCRKSVTGAGPRERDVFAGMPMTDAEPQLNVLALNSGSSSLKFGLYCVGSSRIERLVSGEVESIGDKSGKFHAEDSRGNTLLTDTGPISS